MSPSPSEPRPPFPFIVGCGRSGTTLLRALCDGHPQLAVPPESHFIVELAPRAGRPFEPNAFTAALAASDRYKLWDFDFAFGTTAPTNYAEAVRNVFAAYATARGKPRYADKTPGYVLHVDLLARLFPESVFVHLVRDGRDVVSSFLELGWADTIESAALHWKLRVTRGRRAGRRLGARYLELRYEDLVREPEVQLRTLCAAIALPFSPAMLDHSNRAGELMRTTSHPEYHRRLAQPPTPGLRDWREELAPEEVARFELVAGSALTAFGYERRSVRVPVSLRLDVARHVGRWQLHRARQRLS